MSNVRQVVPFFMVTDISISVDFYVNGIGFEIKNSWPTEGKMHWCWLEIGEAAIMLQEFSTERNQSNVTNKQLGNPRPNRYANTAKR